MTYSLSSSGSSSLGEKEESSNYYSKNPLGFYTCGKIGHLKRYCRASLSDMSLIRKATEEENLGRCFLAEARAISNMVSINLDK